MALAGLVAAIAIPFLVIDSPAPAEGVETDGVAAPASSDAAEPATLTTIAVDPTDAQANQSAAVEIVVLEEQVSPDITRLADQAATWGFAREQAIADGLVEASELLPPSDTNLSLLPVVNVEPVPVEEPEVAEEDPADAETPAADSDVEEPADEAPAPEEDPVEPDPVDEPLPTDVDAPAQIAAPAQVDGRVPPPVGGPTAAQWDALRNCESTHNYQVTNPSGQYRGAYQFSQITWDWVAGIHFPHLVGVDPINAEPGWQDVMAYTLYAMRGWDQWPVCGKNLL